MNLNCPICEKEMEHYVDKMDNILLEEEDKCPDGHYLFHFLTGVTSVFVGNKEFIWNYKTPFNEVRAIGKQIAKAIKEMKVEVDGGTHPGFTTCCHDNPNVAIAAAKEEAELRRQGHTLYFVNGWPEAVIPSDATIEREFDDD